MSSSETPFIIGTLPPDAPMMSWSVLAEKCIHAPCQVSRNFTQGRTAEADALVTHFNEWSWQQEQQPQVNTVTLYIYIYIYIG